ncbi:MAG: hypothetical protein ABIF77_14025 [bacterium]
MGASPLITPALINTILDQYELNVLGKHGLAHWGRVLENGLRLAETTGARPDVVTYFAMFHDACRLNDRRDIGHGHRGAQLAASLHGEFFDLDDAGFALLYDACVAHTDGGTEGDITIVTCWDADRLDLPRAGITPQPSRLCTEPARDPDTIQWARERSLSDFTPAYVHDQWLRGRTDST